MKGLAVLVVGPWEPPESPLPPEVSTYLDAGDAPVLVTLGTSAATNAGHVFDRVADALDRVGARALFLVGDRSNIAGRLADREGAWPFAPLHHVLARPSSPDEPLGAAPRRQSVAQSAECINLN